MCIDLPKYLMQKFSIFCLSVFMLVGTASAAPPSIESFWPPAGQRGKQFTIKLQGANLNSVTAVQFYDPQLHCEQIQSATEYEMEVLVRVDEQCRLDNIPFRLLGKDGFSELHTLRITSLPVLALNGAVDSAVATQAIDRLNVTICNIAKSSSIDRYRVNLSAGQQITAEVEAIRLGHELLDTVIEVATVDGQVISRVDDTALFGQDPTTTFVAKAAGEYEIRVFEANYRGGEKSHYLLHLGDFPPPGVAYPAGGEFGSKLAIEILRETGTDSMAIELPDVEASQDFQLLRDGGEHVSPTPIPFRLANFPNAMENEPNQEPTGETLELPVACNGILQMPGDVDCFRFQAQASVPLSIEAFANRIGSSCDTLIKVVDERLNVLASNDDWGSRDSRLEFYPPVDGTYALIVTDKLKAGEANAVYRVEITPLQPKLVAFLPRPVRTSQEAQTVSVPQGNRTLLRMAVRRELVDADISLTMTGLPSGVHASPALIPSDQFWVPMVVEATTDAPPEGGLAQVIVSADLEKSNVIGGFEQVVDLVAESADQLFTSTKVDRLPVAVTTPVPFAIDLVAPTTPLPQDGSLQVRVNVRREDGFDGPLHIEFPFLPSWVVGDPSLNIPEGEDHGFYRLEARPQAEVREWPLVATARVDTVRAQRSDTASLDRREVSSQLVGLSVQESPLRGTLSVMAAEQGSTVDVTCAFERLGKLPDVMTVTLEGLPNRILAEAVKIGGQDVSQAVFSVHFADDAPLGRFDGVQCRFAGELDGQGVSFIVARDSEVFVAQPGKLMRGENGELLTPLEALRKQTAAQRSTREP